MAPKIPFLPKRWVAHLILISAVTVLGLPLIYAIIVGTQTNAEVFRYQFTPGSALLDNLNTVFVSRGLGLYVVNTIFVAVAITLGKTVFSLLAGMAFVYFRFPGKWIIFSFVLITLMMPTEIMIVALLRFVAIDMGWGSSYAALIVPFLASATGTFLFRPFAVPDADLDPHQLEHHWCFGRHSIRLCVEYVFMAAAGDAR
jgi:sn-glycerol 3-phosphate transport system permease protein